MSAHLIDVYSEPNFVVKKHSLMTSSSTTTYEISNAATIGATHYDNFINLVSENMTILYILSMQTDVQLIDNINCIQSDSNPNELIITFSINIENLFTTYPKFKKHANELKLIKLYQLHSVTNIVNKNQYIITSQLYRGNNLTTPESSCEIKVNLNKKKSNDWDITYNHIISMEQLKTSIEDNLLSSIMHVYSAKFDDKFK